MAKKATNINPINSKTKRAAKQNKKTGDVHVVKAKRKCKHPLQEINSIERLKNIQSCSNMKSHSKLSLKSISKQNS